MSQLANENLGEERREMGSFKSKILVWTLLNAEIPAAVFKPSPGVFAGAEKGFPSS